MRRRILLIATLFLLLFLAIILRLFYWQVVKSESLFGLSQEQIKRESGILPNRGLIYAKDGTPLVINQPVYTVYGQPHLVSDSSYLTEYLSRLLEIDDASISAKLKDKELK